MSQQPEATLESGPQTEVDYVLHTVALADSAVESVGALCATRTFAATINFVASAAAVLVAVGREGGKYHQVARHVRAGTSRGTLVVKVDCMLFRICLSVANSGITTTTLFLRLLPLVLLLLLLLCTSFYY